MDDHFEPDPIKRFDIVGPQSKEKYPHIGELVVLNNLETFRLQKPAGPGLVVGLDYDYEDGVPIFWVLWPDFLSWEDFTNIQRLKK